MASRAVPGVPTEDAIGDRGRSRRRLVSNQRIGRLAEVRRVHMGIQPVDVRRSAVLVVVVVVIGTPIEVGRTLVLIRATVL